MWSKTMDSSFEFINSVVSLFSSKERYDVFGSPLKHLRCKTSYGFIESQ